MLLAGLALAVIPSRDGQAKVKDIINLKVNVKVKNKKKIRLKFYCIISDGKVKHIINVKVSIKVKNKKN